MTTIQFRATRAPRPHVTVDLPATAEAARQAGARVAHLLRQPYAADDDLEDEPYT